MSTSSEESTDLELGENNFTLIKQIVRVGYFVSKDTLLTRRSYHHTLHLNNVIWSYLELNDPMKSVDILRNGLN